MPMMYDSIVLGGGLAGIAAAAHLSHAGQRVALIEARARFGGRVFTHHDPAVDFPLEYGPEWFNDYGEIHGLLAHKRGAIVESDGTFLRRVKGQLRGVDEPDDAWLEMRSRLDGIQGADRSLSQALLECGR